MTRPPPRSTLFPYTTLFRSSSRRGSITAPPLSLFRSKSSASMLETRVSRFRARVIVARSEEHTSELQSRFDLVCRLLLEKKKIEHNTIMQRNTAEQTLKTV